MKVRNIIKTLEAGGWKMEKRTGTAHRKFSHLSKPGKITISGNPGEDMPIGTVKAIMKQAGIHL